MTSSTTSPWSAAVPPGLPPRSMRRRKDCRSRCSTPALSAARPAPARGSKTIWDFRPAFPARRWPAAPTTQAQKFGAEMLIPVSIRSLDCSQQRWRVCAGDRMRTAVARARSIVVASGARYRRPEIENLDGVRRPRRLVLGFADRGAGCARIRMSCWSAAAIPPGRPRCFCPAMRARST